MNALLALFAARLILWILPFSSIQRLASRSSRPARVSKDRRSILSSVLTAARWIPFTTCLTQAFAAQFLLARAGHASVIHLGVATSAAGTATLRAHAWLTVNGCTVLGDFDVEEFQELTALPVA